MKLHEMSKDYIGFLESDMQGEQLTDCLDSIEDSLRFIEYSLEIH